MQVLRAQDMYSPRMHQGRVMSKASETKNTNITDQKWEWKPFSIPQNVIIHHLIILTPLWLSVQPSVETVTHNTTITSQTSTLEHIRPLPLWEEIWMQSEPPFLWVYVCVSVCALVLTELALLGLGHGRPVPGPLDGKTNINLSKILHLGWNTCDYLFTNNKGSHVHSWHTRTHGVVWRPHPTTKVLRRQPSIIKLSFYI